MSVPILKRRLGMGQARVERDDRRGETAIRSRRRRGAGRSHLGEQVEATGEGEPGGTGLFQKITAVNGVIHGVGNLDDGEGSR